MNEKMIGVIGAGVMGAGVTQAFIQANYRVILHDINSDALMHCQERMKNEMRFQGMFNTNSCIEDPEALLTQVDITTDLNKMSEADFIVENVTESWDVKSRVFQSLDNIVQKHTIIAANTSVIPITRLASCTSKQENIIGIHFMNPVPLKNTVEVIKAVHTTDSTISNTLELLQSLGKDGIVVNDWPGFVSNRVLMLTINEAIYLLQENVSTAIDVDKIFKNCFEHKMGPLETADMIGLDTILYSIEQLYEHFQDSKYRPCPLLKQMVYAGKLGRKSGQGFYDYQCQ